MLYVVCAFALFSHSTLAAPKADPRQLKSAAELASSKGDHTNAIKAWTALLDVEPSQINYFYRANSYLKKHQYSHALSDLKSAIKLDNKFIKGLLYQAKIYKIIGHCDDALQVLRDIIATNPNHKEANTELPKAQQCNAMSQQAHQLFASHNYEGAKMLSSQAMEISYDSADLLLLRAKSYFHLRDYQSVLVDTRKILQNDKSNMDALFWRGRAYYYLGEHDNALNHWREGLRLDPERKDLKESTKSLRLLLRRISNGDETLNSNPQESLDEYNMALAHDPSHTQIKPSLLTKKCEALTKLKRYKEAIEACNEAIQHDENFIDAWIKRGEAKLANQDYQDAINDYTKATQINQNHQGAQEGLRNAQVELKKSQMRDYYKDLGLDRNANSRQIKKAFRKLALKYHPDKLTEKDNKEEAEKQFRRVAEAYEVLSDPELKERYDRGEDVKPQPGGGQQQQQHPGFGFPFGFGGGGGGFGGGQQQFHFRFG